MRYNLLSFFTKKKQDFKGRPGRKATVKNEKHKYKLANFMALKMKLVK